MLLTLLFIILIISSKATEPAKENYEFTAETGRLMDILINSLY